MRVEGVGTAVERGLHLLGVPFTWLLVALIKIYQWVISPILGPRCRFYPSCSNYGIGALRTHGPIKGTGLTIVRVCRCHPWQPGGLDPVPHKGAWRPDINPDGSPRNSAERADRQLTDAGV